MIIDGQQRLTSLYAVIQGKKVINENSEEQFISTLMSVHWPEGRHELEDFKAAFNRAIRLYS